jgi:small subunit ribosomal protein S20
LPQRKCAVKALKQSHTKHMHNLDIKTDLKKTIKQFLSTVDSKKKDEAKVNLNTLYKKIDKAAKRNVIAKNTASRRKSRFAKLLSKLN